MTFYQELQLNQAGSKDLLKKSETAKEKIYHLFVYMAKVAVTMAFCFLFVTIFSILLGNENSIVGVVVLLCLMVFRSRNPYRTVYHTSGFVFRSYDCVSTSGKSAFPGTGNAVKYCCIGSADSVRLS